MKKVIITIIISAIIAPLAVFATPNTYNAETKRVLVVCGNDCDVIGYQWDITSERDLFLDFYAKDANKSDYIQGGTVEEIQTKIKTFFSKADNNDTNIVCFIGHGDEDRGLFGEDIIYDRQIAEAVNTLKGHTALFFNCCYAGKLGENVYNMLTLNDVAVITTCGDATMWIGTGEIWAEDSVNLADRNMDNKISVSELHKATKKNMMLYNRACYVARHGDPNKATEAMVFGNTGIDVASVDVSYGYMDYISEQINKLRNL